MGPLRSHGGLRGLLASGVSACALLAGCGGVTRRRKLSPRPGVHGLQPAGGLGPRRRSRGSSPSSRVRAATAHPMLFSRRSKEVPGRCRGSSPTTPARSPASACAAGSTAEEVANNAFYCDSDNTISYDVDFLHSIYHRGGPFAASSVLLHELGHAFNHDSAEVGDFSQEEEDQPTASWARRQVRRSFRPRLREGDRHRGLPVLRARRQQLRSLVVTGEARDPRPAHHQLPDRCQPGNRRLPRRRSQPDRTSRAARELPVAD
jgi:hypothetical protein